VASGVFIAPLLAADERRSTQIENNELEFALSVFIGVYRRPDCFFQRGAFKPQYFDGLMAERPNVCGNGR
jgi:hypothetical protein